METKKGFVALGLIIGIIIGFITVIAIWSKYLTRGSGEGSEELIVKEKIEFPPRQAHGDRREDRHASGGDQLPPKPRANRSKFPDAEIRRIIGDEIMPAIAAAVRSDL